MSNRQLERLNGVNAREEHDDIEVGCVLRVGGSHVGASPNTGEIVAPTRRDRLDV
jgi:hypothetical protein